MLQGLPTVATGHRSSPRTRTHHHRQVFSTTPPYHRLSERPAALPCTASSRGPLRACWLDLIVVRSPPSHRRERAAHGDHGVSAHRRATSVGRPEHLGHWAGPTVLGRGPKACPVRPIFIFSNFLYNFKNLNKVQKCVESLKL
jgi:hypothetical protein